MNRALIVLLLTICWLGVMQKVQAQLKDNTTNSDTADDAKSINSVESSAEGEQQKVLELRKLLRKRLVDDTKEQSASATPTSTIAKVKKPSRKIKGPKKDGNIESEESEESSLEVAEPHEEIVAQEHSKDVAGSAEKQADPSEDFTYDPWQHRFHDIFPDGTYIYGYTLPHGERRYERSYQSENGLVVEGFYTQSRYYRQHLVYELRCYRADHTGYHPMPVEFLDHAPIVQRDAVPDVDCF